MKNFAYYIVVFMVIIAIMRGCNNGASVVATDTILVENVDTVFIDRPVHDTIYKSPRVVKIAIDDVDISEDDSIFIETVQKHYKDSTYEAWVSGIDPYLDSFRVFNRTTVKYITKTVVEPKYISLGYKTPSQNHFGGFIGAHFAPLTSHINIQGGVKLQLNKLDIKAGYNVGEHNYPFVGIEYDIR